MELFLEAFKDMVSGPGELMDPSISIEVRSKDSESLVCDCRILVQYKIEEDGAPCTISILNVNVKHTFPAAIGRRTIVEDVMKTAEKMLISCLIEWFHNRYIPFSKGEIDRSSLYLGLDNNA